MSKTPEGLEPSENPIEHFPDRSLRRLLQDAEYVRGLVGIIAPDIENCLDFRRVSYHQRSFISEALQERESYPISVCSEF